MKETVENYLDKVVEPYNNKNYKEVIKLLPESVLKTFKSAKLYAYRARAHYMLHDDHDLILSYAQKAIDIDDQYFMGYLARGNAWFEKGEYDKAISDYTKAIELNPEDEAAYGNRGNAWSQKNEDDKAISDYTKAIELNPNWYTLYYNRANSWRKVNEPDKAISDYTTSIELNSQNEYAYNNRGITWKEKGEINKAVSDYNKAIELNPNHKQAYYNRGLLEEYKGVRLEDRISDFRKFLELAKEEDDIWVKRAREFIKEFEEKIKDGALKEISEITTAIKKLLLIKHGCITHYTGLTVTKKLIIEAKNKFRISEGSFLNDTSEGTELFKFLQYQFSVRTDGMIAETFAPKPFIGSFVSEEKHDDLNLWRFYGKENGVEAKGCAITLKLNEFIDAINFSISDGERKAASDNEDDINFYKVAYWNHEFSGINFHIPNSSKKDEKKLSELMVVLKNKVSKYDREDTSVLEKYLNNIAFLFKSDAYKNENELRLVVKGIEFEKFFDIESTPPRVYIELVNIRDIIEQITIGPKVDRPDEWAAAFYYSYNGIEEEKKPKKIKISRLPYK